MDDSIDPPRQSLLDVVQERLQKQQKTTVVSRLMYVAQFPDGKAVTKEEAQHHVEGLMKKARGDAEKETGILVVYPTCVLHMIETTTKAIMSLLREINQVPKDDQLLRNLTIISSTEDIPSRGFQKLYHCYVNEAQREGIEAMDVDAMVTEVSDMNINMIKLGKHLMGLGARELDAALESLRSAYPDLPTAVPIIGLCLAEDGPPTLEEFLDIYDRPVDIDLESENVWPMPIPLTFN
mmetsp:Transcript_5862/g.6717  ORF Transcript_5862/g.6717 Transcript_5862/m.6717 type:complete len:237 (+) Transcript_5862:394-1104(+)|eukprot:CAMPEP_0197864324 /NCGR_PEP_ID=MMETSP1438-20131217/42496_1 /TAXON_ID=1461541 /ORGANISM="Pterosperma sp., Strain CCMP1384" /LENGTH=236 /DNA_ID=CAMNT_0043482541 /DNA_START=355 /DNA_END=1065 /DNA_ORIENTATION=-